jgi:hypothetical protein
MVVKQGVLSVSLRRVAAGAMFWSGQNPAD